MMCTGYVLLRGGTRVDPGHAKEIIFLGWPGNPSVFCWMSWKRWLTAGPAIWHQIMDGCISNNSNSKNSNNADKLESPKWDFKSKLAC